ncbi:cysteine proteinase [Lichtheimia hyalospora FSU 10163]|nr:cysteine proteinase [Lichtheimia hyalospora FSU 10163]
MTNLNLAHDTMRNNGIDNDNDACELLKESCPPWRTVGGLTSTTSFGPENKGAKSILTDAMWIAMEDIPTLKEETIEQKCFHWEIDHWSKLSYEERGPVCQVGGSQWNLLLFPQGNQFNSSHVAVFLEWTDAKEALSSQYVCAQYTIFVSSMSDPTNYYFKTSFGRFSKHMKDWGFPDFLSHERLLSFKDDKEYVSIPFLENDCIRFSVIVNVVHDLTGTLWKGSFENYDSKEQTGFVGLKNQGATCYMNSLFQSLYCTNAFRKAVYQIPTEHDNPTDSIALSMQRLFHKLQYSSNAVDTVEVTKSFKWDSLDTLMQHDIQEFNRILQDKLEQKMMGTPADGAIRKLFVGRMKSYIRCIHVDYESTHLEDYYDIQLNVKGCKNLEESFIDYVAEETMDGDNKYMAGNYGLQDAKKGVTFECFPPVLHLQLKRFEYDLRQDTMVKINDRHEFPLRIDLSPYLCPTADRSLPHIYALHGVLVHSGTVSCGHYFAFIKPTVDETSWLKFDDERVTHAALDQVLEHNYGNSVSSGQFTFQNPRQSSNAYMLVYIRECMLGDILDTINHCDIPAHLWKRLEKENMLWQDAQREHAFQQQQLKVNVYSSASFVINDQFGIVSDYQPDPMMMSTFDSTCALQKPGYGRLLRESTTHFALRDALTMWSTNIQAKVEDLMQYMTDDILSLYIECTTEFEPVSHTLSYPWLYTMTDDDDNKDDKLSSLQTNNITLSEQDEPLLIFLKIFIPANQELQGRATMYVYRHHKIASVLDRIRYLASFFPSTPLLLYQEESRSIMRTLQMNATFEESGIETGDIICVQKRPSEEELDHFRKLELYATARQYMAYLSTRVDVVLQPSNGKEQGLPTIKLPLISTMDCQEVVIELTYHTNIDPDYVLLFRPGDGNREAPWVAVKRHEGFTLDNLLAFADPQQPCLQYQVLEMTIDEYESQRLISVIIFKENHASQNTIQVTMARPVCFRELWDKIILETNHTLDMYTGKVRFYISHQHHFREEFIMDDPIAGLSEDRRFQLYAEPIPEDELNLGPGDVLIPVFHFNYDISNTHSVPFRLLIKKDEIFSDTKKRLQARTGLTNEEWARVKCVFIHDDNVEELKDDDKLSDHPYIPEEEPAIGLDHPGKTFKPIFQRPLRIQG